MDLLGNTITKGDISGNDASFNMDLCCRINDCVCIVKA